MVGNSRVKTVVDSLVGKKKPRPKSRGKSVNRLFANSQAIGTFIGQGSVLDGDLIFTGSLRIEGAIYGNVESKDKNGSLVVCRDAKVHGDIRAAHLVINGDVQGSVYSDRSLLLESSAVISGDVRYHDIDMQAGSRVNGELVPQKKPIA